LTSILEGKGTEMPPHGGKITKQQAGGLLAHVRAFARTTEKPRDTEKTGAKLELFDQRMGRLEREMDSLQRQYHKLPPIAPSGTPSTPSQPGQNQAARHSAPAAPGARAAAETFRKRCAKCHGADGTGKKARERLPEIPDFTNPSWQARRADSKLVASILDGRGEDMPSHRGKISEEQARGLVAHIRAFAPTKGSSKQGKRQGPAESNLPKPAPSSSPSDK
jgi:mono/diheme cytochrome c family protein